MSGSFDLSDAGKKGVKDSSRETTGNSIKCSMFHRQQKRNVWTSTVRYDYKGKELVVARKTGKVVPWC